MKYIAMILAILMLLTLTACKNETPVVSDDTAATTTTAKTTTPLPKEGWITADSMRVRGGAGMTHEVIGGITFGEKVEIVDKTGDWYKIRFGDGVGYVSGQYITFTEPATTTTAPDTHSTTVS